MLEMGEPVRILDVARRMIALSGASGIEIVFTGLRAGEKLHEMLFGDEERPAADLAPDDPQRPHPGARPRGPRRDGVATLPATTSRRPVRFRRTDRRTS